MSSQEGCSTGTGLGDVLAQYALPDVAWPMPRGAAESETVRDLYRGCLVWGAAGDALGRPAEGRSPAALRVRFGESGLRDYVPWRGYRGGPRGTITDDTQLTMEVARSLVATGGALQAEELSARLIAWLPLGRGVGQATREAVERLKHGAAWWEAGAAIHSAGNGAAMRAAPVGLRWAMAAEPTQLLRDAVLSALPTHTHPVGVAGAVVIAAGVAWCVRTALAGQRCEPEAFVDFVCAAIQGLEPEPTMERKPGGRPVRLGERIAELPALLDWKEPEEVFAYTHNGAFALESVPAALYCFLRAPDDPAEVILTAVHAGYDADTVASMAGNLVGAVAGARRLERDAPTWWEDLEDRQELVRLADQLAALAIERSAP